MNKGKILVVDDENYILHILDFSLGAEGYEVITAEDGIGNLSADTVTVYFETGNMWPTTYATDWAVLTSDGDPALPDSTG